MAEIFLQIVDWLKDPSIVTGVELPAIASQVLTGFQAANIQFDNETLSPYINQSVRPTIIDPEYYIERLADFGGGRVFSPWAVVDDAFNSGSLGNQALPGHIAAANLYLARFIQGAYGQPFTAVDSPVFIIPKAVVIRPEPAALFQYRQPNIELGKAVDHAMRFQHAFPIEPSFWQFAHLAAEPLINAGLIEPEIRSALQMNSGQFLYT